MGGWGANIRRPRATENANGATAFAAAPRVEPAVGVGRLPQIFLAPLSLAQLFLAQLFLAQLSLEANEACSLTPLPPRRKSACVGAHQPPLQYPLWRDILPGHRHLGAAGTATRSGGPRGLHFARPRPAQRVNEGRALSPGGCQLPNAGERRAALRKAEALFLLVASAPHRNLAWRAPSAGF